MSSTSFGTKQNSKSFEGDTQVHEKVRYSCSGRREWSPTQSSMSFRTKGYLFINHKFSPRWKAKPGDGEKLCLLWDCQQQEVFFQAQSWFIPSHYSCFVGSSAVRSAEPSAKSLPVRQKGNRFHPRSRQKSLFQAARDGANRQVQTVLISERISAQLRWFWYFSRSVSFYGLPTAGKISPITRHVLTVDLRSSNWKYRGLFLLQGEGKSGMSTRVRGQKWVTDGALWENTHKHVWNSRLFTSCLVLIADGATMNWETVQTIRLAWCGFVLCWSFSFVIKISCWFVSFLKGIAWNKGRQSSLYEPNCTTRMLLSFDGPSLTRGSWRVGDWFRGCGASAGFRPMFLLVRRRSSSLNIWLLWSGLVSDPTRWCHWWCLPRVVREGSLKLADTL